MGITIPGELDMALDLLGIEWPNIDEDAVRDAADLVRQLKDDLQGTLDHLDRTVSTDLTEAFKSKAGQAYITAFTENRTQNMDQMLDLLPPAADGIDIFAGALVAMKTKVIAELIITAAQFVVATASAFITGGASLVANGLVMIARKKAIDIATDIAVEQLMAQLLPLVIEPLTETAASLAESILDAPLTTVAGGDAPEFDVSYDQMEMLATAIEDCGADQEDLIETFISQVMSLPIFAS